MQSNVYVILWGILPLSENFIKPQLNVWMSVSAEPRQRHLGIFTNSLAATFYLNVLFLWPKFIILLYVKWSFAFVFSRNYQQYFKLHCWPEHIWSSHFNPSPKMRWLKAMVRILRRTCFHFCFTLSQGWDWNDLISGMKFGWFISVVSLLRSTLQGL